MEKGYWNKGIRAKDGAMETIDNVTKFALDDSDYEEYEEWVEYTAEELAEMEEAQKRAEFNQNAPAYFAALTSAFGEVE